MVQVHRLAIYTYGRSTRGHTLNITTCYDFATFTPTSLQTRIK